MVPTSAYAVDIGTNGGACVAFGSIEAAVAAASSGDVLHVAPGTYSENTIVLTSKDLTIESANAACAPGTTGAVTINASGGGRIFELEDSFLTLRDLDVGLASSSQDGAVAFLTLDSILTLDATRFYQSTSGGDGGCIYAEYSSVTLFNGSELDRCWGTNNGGGAYLDNSTMWVLGGTSIHDSDAVTGDGGGVYVDESNLYAYGDITDNTARWGGGVFVTSWVNVDGYALIRGNLSRNAAEYGGGAYVQSLNDSIRFSDDAVVEGNTATFDGGGALVSSGSLYIEDEASFVGNHADDDGGGAYVSFADEVIVAGGGLGDVRFDGNTADGKGAGMYLANSSMEATFVDFVGNVAGAQGGGIYTEQLALTQTLDLRNARFHSNQGSFGGGILAKGDVLVDIESQFTSCDPTALAKGRFCSELAYNQATATSGKGGAIRLVDGASLDLRTTGAFANEATVGGGVVSVKGAGSNAFLLNVLAWDNQTTTGAAFGAGSGADLDIRSSTITGSHVPVEFGAGATGAFHRNIVWGNTNDAIASTVSGNCNITQTAGGAPSGSANVQSDPLFDSTNSRSSYKLQSGSPAIDACGTGPTYDLDGTIRALGLDYDRGAFEMP